MPFPHATAAILSVGDELTLGQTLDTNSRWLSERLGAIGIITAEHVTVPDIREAQAEAFSRLATKVDLIVCTGGLGPTLDDLTRAALADAMDDNLVEDPIALAQVESFYQARNRPMPPINRVQAQRPSRASVLANLNGTAPGLHAILDTRARDSESHHIQPAPHPCEVFCLPGPPSEMKPMFDAQVLPRLRPASERCVRTRVLRTIGLGESDIATRLGDMMARDRVPLVGTTASGSIVSIRLRYEGPLAPDDAESLLDNDERSIKGMIAPHVFGLGDETLAHAVVRALRSASSTLALVESCTGGGLASRVTSVPGASAVLLAGWIPYSNEAKQRDLGVPSSLFEPGGPGAVSKETAQALALGALQKSGATHCLAITGLAGPTGGSADKPVGTVFIARATKSDTRDPTVDVRRFAFPGDRDSVRDWSARSALAMLWLFLQGTPDAALLRQAGRY